MNARAFVITPDRLKIEINFAPYTEHTEKSTSDFVLSFLSELQPAPRA
jgi:hypothetical protein